MLRQAQHQRIFLKDFNLYLAPGRAAEISVLRIDEGPAELSDGHETIVAERRLVPVGCVRAGEWIDATLPSAEAAA